MAALLQSQATSCRSRSSGGLHVPAASRRMCHKTTCDVSACPYPLRMIDATRPNLSAVHRLMYSSHSNAMRLVTNTIHRIDGQSRPSMKGSSLVLHGRTKHLIRAICHGLQGPQNPTCRSPFARSVHHHASFRNSPRDVPGPIDEHFHRPLAGLAALGEPAGIRPSVRVVFVFISCTEDHCELTGNEGTDVDVYVDGDNYFDVTTEDVTACA